MIGAAVVTCRGGRRHHTTATSLGHGLARSISFAAPWLAPVFAYFSLLPPLSSGALLVLACKPVVQSINRVGGRWFPQAHVRGCILSLGHHLFMWCSMSSHFFVFLPCFFPFLPLFLPCLATPRFVVMHILYCFRWFVGSLVRWFVGRSTHTCFTFFCDTCLRLLRAPHLIPSKHEHGWPMPRHGACCPQVT